MFPTIQGSNLDWPVVDDDESKEEQNRDKDLDDFF